MIEIKNLVKKYDETLAINDLNITFKEGIYGLVGHNGAGKSTLLRIISNVVYKTSGTITVNGHDSKTKEARDNIFFLPDYPYSKGNMDIDQMYKFYSIFYDIDKDNFYRLINEFELPLKRRISTFSKGMRRQAFIALSLSMNRNVILMDEPFDGLDPLVLIKIKDELLKKKLEGKTIILASHNISSLEKIVDSFVLISNGTLSKSGTMDDLSSEFVKYQAFIKGTLTKEDLESFGLNIISFKMVGSIYNFVVRENSINVPDLIKSKYETYLIEVVPIDNEEIMAINMATYKGGK